MSQRTANLQEWVTDSFDYQTNGMYTSLPGIVVSVVDAGDMLVNVQPTVNLKTEDDFSVTQRPSILNVPLVMPLTKDGGLSFPVQAGDLVWLTFSMRGLDAWKSSNGYPTTPLDMRKFDIRDCVAQPCVYPSSESPNNPSKRSLEHNPLDVVLVHNIGSGNEVEIRLKASGGVEINAPGQEVKVVCNTALVEADTSVTLDTPETLLTGNIVVQGTMTIDGDSGGGTNTIRGNFNIVGNTLNHNDVDISSTHRHSGVESGPDNSGTPI